MKISITGGAWLAVSVLSLALFACTGSDGKPSMFGNPDKALDDKTSAQFAADAATRKYESDAPRGGPTAARAEYEVMTRRIDLVNLSDTDWTNVEVWINQKYVVLVPTMEKNVDKKLDFEMFFDQTGHHFDTDGGKNPLRTIEVYREGKIYSVIAKMY